MSTCPKCGGWKSKHPGMVSVNPPECTCEGNGAMNFGEAIEQLKLGHRVARDGWNGKGLWLELQVPDAHSKMSLPYIYMKTVDDNLVPWLASQTDMLADDWMALVSTDWVSPG